MARDEDDRHVRHARRCAQFIEYLETAHSGQLGVQQDEVRGAVVYQLQRFLTAGGEAQLTDAMQDTAYEIDRTRVVIHHHYFIVHEIDFPLQGGHELALA